MKKRMSLAAMTAFCGLAWSTGRLPDIPTVSAQAGGAALYDWTTDGGDNQRTGWNKQEKTLTKDNVKNLKLLWKLETKNQVRALHSLMPVLVVAQLNTPAGAKQVGFLAGISDNLYAFDTDTGQIIWQKHWDYEAPAGRGGGGVAVVVSSRRIPRTSGSCAQAAAAIHRSSVRRTRRDAGRSISLPATACFTS